MLPGVQAVEIDNFMSAHVMPRLYDASSSQAQGGLLFDTTRAV